MAHVKYFSIENYDNRKARQGFLEAIPGDEPVVLYEKIDGANLQLLFRPHETILVGRRNGWIGEGETFFGVRDVLKQYTPELGTLQSYVDSTGRALKVYGELFGPGILDRIYYGPKKRIAFFDVRVDDLLLAPADMETFLKVRQLGHMIVPGMEIVPNGAALQTFIQNAFGSKGVASKAAPGHTAEGVVVRPFNANYRTAHGYAILKLKSPEFVEKENAPKKGPAPVHPLQDAFRAYCNASRVASVVSKLGAPDKANIAKVYIPALKEDALEDFYKDHPELTPEERKIVAKTGKLDVYRMFLAHT